MIRQDEPADQASGATVAGRGSTAGSPKGSRRGHEALMEDQRVRGVPKGKPS
jgi:hypothetical protein